MAALIAVVAITATGCAAGVDPDLESGAARGWSLTPADDDAAPDAADTADATSPQIIDASTPVGAVAQTILGWLNADPNTLNPDEITALATPELSASLGAGGLLVPIAQLNTGRPFTATDFRSVGSEAEFIATTGNGFPVDFRVAVDEQGKLTGILARAVPPAVADWSDVDDAIGRVGNNNSVLAARITDGTCVPVHSANANDSMQMASVSKLYILGALARAIGNGTVGWDDSLTITENNKSAPSGTLQNSPAGTVVTVREAAEQMIAISDNTAADLLLDYLGRGAVEAALTTMGHHDPASVTPFPTTRETFLLGWGVPDSREQWRNADTAQRRQILAALDSAPLTLDYTALAISPVPEADDIGWYGTANDICSAYASLINGPQSTEVRRILALQPGIQLDPAAWPYVGFKSGNLPGAVTGSWLATDTAGQDWVVATQVESDAPIGLLDNNYIFAVGQQAFGLLR